MGCLNMINTNNIRLDDFEQTLNVPELNEIDLSKTIQKSIGEIDSEFIFTTAPKELNYIFDDENVIWQSVLNTQNEEGIVDNVEINNIEFSDPLLSQLTEEEKVKVKSETGWSDEIIDNIENMRQYEVLKDANLVEVEINGRPCLIKKDINLDYTDADGISNRDRIKRGLAPIDEKTGRPLELHHLGQKADSPLVELSIEEHRTGEYVDGKKNQTLWHDNTKVTEVHGEGNTWDEERKSHWKTRSETIKE